MGSSCPHESLSCIMSPFKTSAKLPAYDPSLWVLSRSFFPILLALQFHKFFYSIVIVHLKCKLNIDVHNSILGLTKESNLHCLLKWLLKPFCRHTRFGDLQGCCQKCSWMWHTYSWGSTRTESGENSKEDLRWRN